MEIHLGQYSMLRLSASLHLSPKTGKEVSGKNMTVVNVKYYLDSVELGLDVRQFTR